MQIFKLKTKVRNWLACSIWTWPLLRQYLEWDQWVRHTWPYRGNKNPPKSCYWTIEEATLAKKLLSLRRNSANRSSTATIIRDSRTQISLQEIKMIKSLATTQSCRCLTLLLITALVQQLLDETIACWTFTRKELQKKHGLNSGVMPSTTRWTKWLLNLLALRTKISVSN